MATKAEQFKSEEERTHKKKPAPAAKPKKKAAAKAKAKGTAGKSGKHGDTNTGPEHAKQMKESTPENKARRSVARAKKVRGSKGR